MAADKSRSPCEKDLHFRLALPRRKSRSKARRSNKSPGAPSPRIPVELTGFCELTPPSPIGNTGGWDTRRFAAGKVYGVSLLKRLRMESKAFFAGCLLFVPLLHPGFPACTCSTVFAGEGQ